MKNGQTKEMRTISRQELAKHNNEGDGRWVLIDDDVYDVSSFHNFHPGGSKILTDLAGKDASDAFWALHRQEVLHKWGDRLRVGKIEGWDEDNETESLGDISNVPFAEHIADVGYDSPYYTDSHLEFRENVRKWVYERLYKSGIAEEIEESGERVPDELFKEMGRRGVLAGRLGPGAHLQVWQREVAKDPSATIFGVDPNEYDYFHERILHEEFVRCACPGFVAGCGDGYVIGCPPIFQFGPKWMQKEILPSLLAGTKRICLAISEPQAGSDVANLCTTAERSADGSFYTVSGTKKWYVFDHIQRTRRQTTRTIHSPPRLPGLRVDTTRIILSSRFERVLREWVEYLFFSWIER